MGNNWPRADHKMSNTSAVAVAVVAGFDIVHGLLIWEKNKRVEVVETKALWGEDQDFVESEYWKKNYAGKKWWSNRRMKEGCNCWGRPGVLKHKTVAVVGSELNRRSGSR